MIGGLFEGLNERGVSPVIAIVLLLMMTVAAAGAAYFWITSMQSSVQQSAGSQIEAITKQASTRIIAQATICKPTHGLKGLVGYWQFEEGEGDQVHDSSENSNNGTVYGANWTDGKIGQALEFDGVDDKVELPFGFLPKDPDEFTINVWSYHETPNDGDVDTDIALMINWRIWMRDEGDGQYWYTFAGDNDAEFYTPIEANKWTMWTMWFSSSEGEARFYKNGEFLDSASASGLDSKSWGNYIGANWHGVARYLDGRIDEVRIYDRALSQDEIEYLYKVEKNGWHLGNVSVTVYNAGAEEVPEGTWVANLKKDGNIVDSDTYNASSLGSEERKTLKFYFGEMEPNNEYTIELEGTETSTTVSC